MLDCRGLYCPLPVLRTERALVDLATGEVLEVVATDPVAEIDMAVFSQRSGHELLRRERRGEELIFFFRRAERPGDRGRAGAGRGGHRIASPPSGSVGEE